MPRGAPKGNKNAKKSAHLKRVNLSSAMIPSWMADELRTLSQQSKVSLGQLVEDALVTRYGFFLEKWEERGKKVGIPPIISFR